MAEITKYSENINDNYWKELAQVSKERGFLNNINPLIAPSIWLAAKTGSGQTNDSLFNSAQQFYDNYLDAGLTTDDLNNYLITLYRAGKLDSDTYNNAINSLEKYQKTHGEDGNWLSSTWWDAWTSRMNKKQLAQLYEAMTEGLDVYKNVDKMSIDELVNGIREGITANAPTISGVPAPTYNQVRTGTPAGYPVGPVPLWTGQELADLNNTNWDPTYYYNLIKAGTVAAVQRDLFGVDQRDYASTIADDRAKASYLDNIRNIKSEAIANGATRGARAANEMLATRENATTYADNQNKVRQNNYNAMLDSLLADASASLTARDYFTNLAEDRYNEGVQFYTNDTDAQGQERLTDAELYSADVQDRAQANYANALMDQAHAQNAANANVARGAVNNIANEYAWLFNTFAEANNGNVNKTVSDMDQYLFNRYTNQTNLKNFVNAVNK